MNDSKKEDQRKQLRGRPAKNVIKPIDSMPEELARAIFRNADRELAQKRKIKT